MSQHTTKLCDQQRPVWPAKTRISLYIHPVWKGFLIYPSLDSLKAVEAHAISEDSDQTASRCRLIWVFACRVNLIVGFVMRWHIIFFYFSKETICMKCQSLFFWENNNNNKKYRQFKCFRFAEYAQRVVLVNVAYAKIHTRTPKVSLRSLTSGNLFPIIELRETIRYADEQKRSWSLCATVHPEKCSLI